MSQACGQQLFPSLCLTGGFKLPDFLFQKNILIEWKSLFLPIRGGRAGRDTHRVMCMHLCVCPRPCPVPFTFGKCKNSCKYRILLNNGSQIHYMLGSPKRLLTQISMWPLPQPRSSDSHRQGLESLVRYNTLGICLVQYEFKFSPDTSKWLEFWMKYLALCLRGLWGGNANFAEV